MRHPASTGSMRAARRASVHPHLPPRTWRETLVTSLVIMLGFLLAFGLALLVLA